MRLNRFLVMLALLAWPVSAQAYVGPGLGLGAIGVVLGMLLSIVLAFFAFIWMPIKRLLSKGKRDAPDNGEPLGRDADSSADWDVDGETGGGNE